MLFKDRRDAGNRLAQALTILKGSHPLILAVPRGGVVVAAPVAAFLGGEMDLIIPRKVGAPLNPELAVAAVAPDGTVIYNEPVMHSLGLKARDLDNAVARELEEIERRLRLYRGHNRAPQVQGRVVIVIDDGIATGMTIEAALRALKKERPARLVLAIPVAPADTLSRLRPLADDLVCLATPEPFYAVGQFYEEFEQLTDAEVMRLLGRPAAAPGT